MTEPLFDVRLEGFDGIDPPAAVAGLASVFHIERSKARQLLDALPWVVKHQVPLHKARRLQSALQNIGGRVSLLGDPLAHGPPLDQPPAQAPPVDKPPPVDQPPPVDHAPPAPNPRPRTTADTLREHLPPVAPPLSAAWSPPLELADQPLAPPLELQAQPPTPAPPPLELQPQPSATAARSQVALPTPVPAPTEFGPGAAPPVTAPFAPTPLQLDVEPLAAPWPAAIAAQQVGAPLDLQVQSPVAPAGIAPLLAAPLSPGVHPPPAAPGLDAPLPLPPAPVSPESLVLPPDDPPAPPQPFRPPSQRLQPKRRPRPQHKPRVKVPSLTLLRDAIVEHDRAKLMQAFQGHPLEGFVMVLASTTVAFVVLFSLVSLAFSQ